MKLSCVRQTHLLLQVSVWTLTARVLEFDAVITVRVRPVSVCGVRPTYNIQQHTVPSYIQYVNVTSIVFFLGWKRRTKITLHGLCLAAWMTDGHKVDYLDCAVWLRSPTGQLPETTRQSRGRCGRQFTSILLVKDVLAIDYWIFVSFLLLTERCILCCITLVSLS